MPIKRLPALALRLPRSAVLLAEEFGMARFVMHNRRCPSGDVQQRVTEHPPIGEGAEFRA